MTLCSLTIHHVPCLRDNYAYLVSSDDEQAIVIDPSEAEPVRTKLDELGWKLVAILNTHHHWDHVGGNEALLAAQPELAVIAHQSDRERVHGMTRGVSHDECFEVAGISVRAIHVPGHTLGAVTFVMDGAAFTGDTLFIGGCGRLFEGTPAMMHTSLSEKLGALPSDTRIYCGHEYTESNLRFAQTVEPDNHRIREKLAWATERSARGEPTVPSTIADELATNPFMRCSEASVKSRYPGATSAEVLGAVRAAKDRF